MASKAIYPGRELSNLRGCGGVRSEFCPVCEFTRDWYVRFAVAKRKVVPYASSREPAILAQLG